MSVAEMYAEGAAEKLGVVVAQEAEVTTVPAPEVSPEVEVVVEAEETKLPVEEEAQA